MEPSRGDLHHIVQPDDIDRTLDRTGLSRTELPAGVLSPAGDGAVLTQRACVAIADRQRDRILGSGKLGLPGNAIVAFALAKAAADGGLAFVSLGGGMDAAEHVLYDLEDLGAPAGYIVDVTAECPKFAGMDERESRRYSTEPATLNF